MGKTKDVFMALNGKKTPITLVIFIATTILGYGQLKENVKHNSADLYDLKKVPQQVASIETDVSNIKKNVEELNKEQKDIGDDVEELKLAQGLMGKDIKIILKAVIK